MGGVTIMNKNLIAVLLLIVIILIYGGGYYYQVNLYRPPVKEQPKKVDRTEYDRIKAQEYLDTLRKRATKDTW